MYARSHRLFRSFWLVLCCVCLFPLTAQASEKLYTPYELRVAQKNAATQSLLNTYYLEKNGIYNNANNPFGSMPKNKALTVAKSPSTIVSVAKKARKATPAYLAWTGAIAAAGWFIDELTGDIVITDYIESIPEYYEPGRYFNFENQLGLTPPQAIQKWINASPNNRRLVSIQPQNSIGNYPVIVETRSSSSGVWSQLTRTAYRGNCTSSISICQNVTFPLIPVTNPVPQAEQQEKIAPAILQLPNHQIEDLFKDDFGRPIMTPELAQALHDWYSELASRDSSLEYNRATGTWTYTDPETNISESFQANPEDLVNADPSESTQTVAGSDWPGFCDWATIVCDFIEWVKEEPELEEPDMPENTVHFEMVEFNSGLGNGSCPPPVQFGLQGQNGEFTFDTACMVSTTYLKPIVLASAAILAGFILLGARGVA